MAMIPALVSLTAITVWPLYVPAAFVIGWLAWQRQQSGGKDSPPLYTLVNVLLSPFVLSLWAGAVFGVESGAARGRTGWASGVLMVLALAVVGHAGLVLWWWRARWLPATFCCLVALITTAISWFVGAMAIADDWL